MQHGELLGDGSSPGCVQNEKGVLAHPFQYQVGFRLAWIIFAGNQSEFDQIPGEYRALLVAALRRHILKVSRRQGRAGPRQGTIRIQRRGQC